MVPANALINIREIILLIKLALISSISCSKLPVPSDEVNMTCLIEYESSKKVDVKFWFQFDSKVSSNMSNWEFGLEKCDPNLYNHFCEVWEKKDRNIKMCRMISDYRQVFCIKQINLFSEVGSTKPYKYRFFANHSSKIVVSKEIGKIRYLECGCHFFDFEQKLKITFSYLRKADIRIGPFYDIPKLVDTKLDIDPNNVLSIKKYSDIYFKISGLNICPTYNITVKLETWPTCTNWKIKPILLDYPIEKLTIYNVSCKFNQTHTTLNISADSDSQFYYNLSFMNEIITKNVTKKLTLQNKCVKNKHQNNLTVFVTLCAHGCRKCGTKKPFICYSEVFTENRKEEVSKIMLSYLWLFLGIFFVVIFIALLCAKYWRNTRGSNNKGVRDTYYFRGGRLINGEVHELSNSEQMEQNPSSVTLIAK